MNSTAMRPPAGPSGVTLRPRHFVIVDMVGSRLRTVPGACRHLDGDPTLGVFNLFCVRSCTVDFSFSLSESPTQRELQCY